MSPWWSLPLVAALAWWLTGAMRRYALTRQLLDIPNARSSHTTPTPRGGGVAIVAWLAVVGVATAGVHPLFTVWGATQAVIRDAIARTLPGDAVYVTNWIGTRKFVDFAAQKYVRIERDQVTPHQIQLLVQEYEAVYVVLVGRNDSEHWIRDGERTDAFLASLRNEPKLLVDRRPSPVDRVRVWRLDENSPARR